jgi:hypothetical protein
MEHEPLLAPGLHDFELHDIGNHFLSNFPNSSTRKNLIDGLNNYIGLLSVFGIPLEIWLDGSFTTKKTDPCDIDLVIFASVHDLNNLTVDGQRKFLGLTERHGIKHFFGCDVLFSVKEDDGQRSYWRGWYGFDRLERPKGIARIMVNS